MKKVLKTVFASVLVMGVFVLVSCGSSDDGPKVDAPIISVTSITAGSTAALDFGGSIIITITGTDLTSLDVDIDGGVSSINLSGDAVEVTVDLSTLEVGSYNVVLTASDQSGNETVFEFSLTVAYASNHAEMYLRGEMNSWGTTEMTLTSNNTWSVSGVGLDAGETEYKFSNTTDWSDLDWGLGIGFSGTHQEVEGEGTNGIVTLESAGNFTFTFNDDDLSFTISTDAQ